MIAVLYRAGMVLSVLLALSFGASEASELTGNWHADASAGVRGENTELDIDDRSQPPHLALYLHERPQHATLSYIAPTSSYIELRIEVWNVHFSHGDYADRLEVSCVLRNATHSILECHTGQYKAQLLRRSP